MPALPKQITDFMEAYGIDADEVWQVHGSSWVVKHKALERVAVEMGITFDPPVIVQADASAGIAVIHVTGKLDTRTEWSFGEAAPKNNKNAYPFAMCEKRAKDRVILKLLNTHGVIYSEEEADDFKNKDETGKLAVLSKKDAREVYTKLQREVNEYKGSREGFREWMAGNKDRILILPEDWQDILRLQCEEKLADLRQQEVA
jgi:hypothetical protein